MWQGTCYSSPCCLKTQAGPLDLVISNSVSASHEPPIFLVTTAVICKLQRRNIRVLSALDAFCNGNPMKLTDCCCRFVGGLSSMHIFFTSQNTTTYEHFRSRYNAQGNPYDVGLLGNWRQIFCQKRAPRIPEKLPGRVGPLHLYLHSLKRWISDYVSGAAFRDMRQAENGVRGVCCILPGVNSQLLCSYAYLISGLQSSRHCCIIVRLKLSYEPSRPHKGSDISCTIMFPKVLKAY